MLRLAQRLPFRSWAVGWLSCSGQGCGFRIVKWKPRWELEARIGQNPMVTFVMPRKRRFIKGKLWVPPSWFHPGQGRMA